MPTLTPPPYPVKLKPPAPNSYAATTDFGAAAYAIALGHPIELVNAGPGRLEFRFPAAAQTDLDNYYKNAPISARSYSAAMRDLRSLINRSGR